MLDLQYLNVFFCIKRLGNLDDQILRSHLLQKELFDLFSQDLQSLLETMELKEYQPQQLDRQ